MTRRRISVSPTNLRGAVAGAIHRYRQVLDQKNSRTLLLAAVASSIGDWLSFVALMALAVDFGEGALGVGGMLALRLIPGILFQGFAGTIVDRVRGNQLLIVSQLVMAVFAWSFLLLNTYENLWLLYLLVVLLEIANTFARPAFMVQVVNSVEPDHRGAVNGLFGMSITIAQFAGSLTGALVLHISGVSPLFILNGITFLMIAVAVARLRLPTIESEPSPALSFRESITGIVEGFYLGYGQLLRRSDVLAYTLVTLSVSMLIQAAIALFEVRARSLDLDEGGGGAFFAALAVGFLLGGAIAGTGRYRSTSTLYLIAAAELIGVLGVITFGLADSLLVIFAALFFTGITAELSEVPAFTFFQNRLPEEIYGRFFSLFLTAIAIGGLAGALGGPLLEQHISEGTTLILLATPGLLMAVKLALVAWSWDSEGPGSVRVDSRDQYSSIDYS
jgi:MFS family permease